MVIVAVARTIAFATLVAFLWNAWADRSLHYHECDETPLDTFSNAVVRLTIWIAI